jgi:hypothetical protein
LRKTIAESPDQNYLGLAIVYTSLNDYDQAFTFLDKAYQVREVNLYYLKIDPELKPIRNDPRFKALLKKIRLD